ncbi:MAG: tetratricopeptide repeat protein [Pseudomonadota bacterium]|nr:tetratricopeptide repeat protein [Pseudomonadota bacterium]
MTRRYAALVTALLAAIVVAWAPAMHAPFTYDDRIEVVGNRTIRWLDDVGAIASYNTSRPLLIVTYAFNWWLGGLEPFGYHVLSVGIHAINALLAWRLAGRLVTPGRAALVASLWALHPLTTDAVTYITGRSDALEATAWLVALTAWIDHRRGSPRARTVAVVAVGAALLTKEVGALLPVALLAIDRWIVAPKERDARRWRDHLVFAGAGAAAVALRLWMYGWPKAEVPRDAVVQVLSQAEVWGRYLVLWLVPIGQSILHDHPAVARLAGALSLIGWAGAMLLVVRRARPAPDGPGRPSPTEASPAAIRAFALVVWAAWLVPSSAVPLLETMAEHRSYFAGFALILAAVASLPAAGLRPAWVLVPVLLLATVARNRVWSDEAALWRGAAMRYPASARAWYGYGDALRLAQRFAEAEPAYTRAAELDPGDPNARINLGIVRAESGDDVGARAAWLEVLRSHPKSCDASNNLGTLASRAGELEAAASRYASTLRACPDDAHAHINLANLAFGQADMRKAAFHYREYLRVAEDGPAAPLARERLARMGLE